MLITPNNYDAVLFDMDGVLTMTMKIHATCWKRMFDAYLRDREERFNEPFQPFEISTDYKAYVDGRLRYDGVQAFLLSRDILLPYGQPDDDPVIESICGLGNRKDVMVNQLIDEEGVEILQGSLQVVEMVRKEGLKTAVVSASKNCEKILDAAAIKDHFDVMV
ncbi:MAG: HAD hydrolase-like protein, partial [Gammaproteobacteria bacterium]|nr:HAD hydrolase-like protein [Gammaproteobacteria bacterium]NIR93999.1 HAD hydrolase-like protein [Gammaproteobacteria bacterium]